MLKFCNRKPNLKTVGNKAKEEIAHIFFFPPFLPLDMPLFLPTVMVVVPEDLGEERLPLLRLFSLPLLVFFAASRKP